MPKIAKSDREAMNELYAQAMKKAGQENPFLTDQIKSDHAEQDKVQADVLKEDAKELNGIHTAAKNEGWTEEAFSDHKDFLDTLEDALSDDGKESWDPNEVTLD